MTRLRTRLDENLVCLYLQAERKVKKEEERIVKTEWQTRTQMSTKKVVKFSFHYAFLERGKITIRQLQKATIS
jgi:isocitrate/isopropylmalate dehydrogenase